MIKPPRLMARFLNFRRRINLFLSKRVFPHPNLEVVSAASIERVKNGQPRAKILYIALQYDYGNELKGLSYEEYTYFYTLKNMSNIEVIRFDYYSYVFKYGKKFANNMLKEIAVNENIDKLIIFLFLDTFDHNLIEELSSAYKIQTIIWLFDDDKRYEATKKLTEKFNKAITTLKSRHEMRQQRCGNSYLDQFGANHYLYRDFNIERVHDVVFVGQNFGNRSEYVTYLEDHGINILAYGSGWGLGRLSQAEMIEKFNKAKIVLNFSASEGRPDFNFIKGRVFEVPPTGAMLITEQCEELEDYFSVPGEVEVFHNKQELLTKVKYYLENPLKRHAVARAGKEKVLSKYTIEITLERILF